MNNPLTYPGLFRTEEAAEGFFIPLAALCSQMERDETFAFLSECSFESLGFTRLRESLDYTPAALQKVFGMSPGMATLLGRSREHAADQVKIARLVYGGRLGNRRDNLDGWNYRGGGPIQLTGLDQYIEASHATGIDLVEHPDRIIEPAVGADVSAWWWGKHKCGQILKDHGIKGVCRMINRGNPMSAIPALGEPARVVLYQHLKEYSND